MIDPVSLIIAVAIGDGVPIQFGGEVIHVARPGSTLLRDGGPPPSWYVSHPEHAPYKVDHYGNVTEIAFEEFNHGD